MKNLQNSGKFANASQPKNASDCSRKTGMLLVSIGVCILIGAITVALVFLPDVPVGPYRRKPAICPEELLALL